MISYSIICRLMVSAVLVAVMGLPLYAQSPSVAIGGGYERGDVRIEFTSLNNNRYNNAFVDEIDQASAFCEFAVPLCDESSIMIVPRISLRAANVAFLAPTPDVVIVVDDTPLSYGAQEEISFSMQTVQVELLGRLRIIDGLSLAVGPGIGYRITQDYRHSQIFDTTLPIDHKRLWPAPSFRPHFEDNGSRYVIDDGSNLQKNQLAIGALFVAEYELPLYQQLSLVPELRLRGDFTSPFANANWNLFSAGGAISVRYSL